MQHHFVAASQGLAAGQGGFPERTGPRFEDPRGSPAPHLLRRLRKPFARLFGRLDRILGEWPCDEVPGEGELILAGLGSPVFSLSRFGSDSDRARKGCGSPQ